MTVEDTTYICQQMDKTGKLKSDHASCLHNCRLCAQPCSILSGSPMQLCPCHVTSCTPVTVQLLVGQSFEAAASSLPVPEVDLLQDLWLHPAPSLQLPHAAGLPPCPAARLPAASVHHSCFAAAQVSMNCASMVLLAVSLHTGLQTMMHRFQVNHCGVIGKMSCSQVVRLLTS